MSELRCVRIFPAALHFHVLSHLRLERDAASLFIARRRVPPWVGPLQDSYRLAPARSSFQFVGLEADDLADLFGRLELKTQQGHTADRRLAETLWRALRVETAGFQEIWSAGTEREAARLWEWQTRYGGILETLLGGLRAESSPRLLTLYDCRSLTTHGRGLPLPEEQRVAVSLGGSDLQVLFQAFHEAVHPVSDPLALSGVQMGLKRDTEAGQPGYELHRRLECAALELGEAVVTARQPALLKAYQRWRLNAGQTPSVLRRWLQQLRPN